MSIILGIETSTRRTSVAILSQDRMLFDSDSLSVTTDGFDLSNLVADALQAAGVVASDLSAVAVDIGPGGLNAVRAGVTFANGLALSLSIPILQANSLEIMAHQARSATDLPVICVRGATSENACVALYDNSSDSHPIYGPLAIISDHVRHIKTSHAVAGRLRHQLLREIESPLLIDSTIEGPTAAAMLSFLARQHPSRQASAAPIQIIYPE